MIRKHSIIREMISSQYSIVQGILRRKHCERKYGVSFTGSLPWSKKAYVLYSSISTSFPFALANDTPSKFHWARFRTKETERHDGWSGNLSMASVHTVGMVRKVSDVPTGDTDGRTALLGIMLDSK